MVRLLVTSNDTIHIPSFSVDVVDTTGAGDAFSGTLSVAVAEGLPLFGRYPSCQRCWCVGCYPFGNATHHAHP